MGPGTQRVTSEMCWSPGQHGGCMWPDSREFLPSPSQLGGWKTHSARPWVLFTVDEFLPGKVTMAFPSPGITSGFEAFSGLLWT